MISKYRIPRIHPYTHDSRQMANFLLILICLCCELLLKRLKTCRKNAPLTRNPDVIRLALILRQMPNPAYSFTLAAVDVL